MMSEVVWIANTVIGESALPHFGTPPAKSAEGMRVSALDQLDGALYRYVLSRSKQYMDMIGHEDEGMQRVAALSAVAIKGLEE
jgi:hypothetical protein